MSGRTELVPIVQGNYGYGDGWEDLSEYERGQRAEALADLREYLSAEPYAAHRIIMRRVPIATREGAPAAG